jgi:hypothetical protein
VADLAGREAAACHGTGGELGTHTVDCRIGESSGGLVVAASGEAGGNAAAHLEDGNLVALGAGIDPGHSLAAMRVDPSRRMVVAIVLIDA